jgi:predicted nucleotidyltransferase
MDAKTIRRGVNFTLRTTVGDIDLLGEVAGGETYQTLLPHSFEVEAFGIRFKFIDLPTPILIKAAAGRRKELEAFAELGRTVGRDREKASLGMRWSFERKQFVY